MEVVPLLQKELDAEAKLTRKMLERVPEDKWDWKPHEKSMTMSMLTVHLAEIPGWVQMALTSNELDFAKMDYKPTPVSSTAELMQIFEKSVASGQEALSTAKEEDLLPEWP